MAKLRDEKGTIVIDSTEANADIANLNKARQSLEAAKKRILDEKKRLSPVWQGSAYDTYIEKSDALVKSINDMIASIQAAIKDIADTVAKYEEVEKRVVATLQSSPTGGNWI